MVGSLLFQRDIEQVSAYTINETELLQMLGFISNLLDREKREMIRKHMKIYGDVQGVGFRYRAEHAANMLRLTGWVKNEWDGTVEMEVQGEREAIDRLLVVIGQGTYVRIEKVDSELIAVNEEERSFHVR